MYTCFEGSSTGRSSLQGGCRLEGVSASPVRASQPNKLYEAETREPGSSFAFMRQADGLPYTVFKILPT